MTLIRTTRTQWKSILTIELMSSDESDYNDNGKEVLVSYQLPWLSDAVNNFKQVLDRESLKGKMQQSLRQMKPRIEGSPSTRQHPDLEEPHKHPA